jgi:hypothetical protein
MKLTKSQLTEIIKEELMLVENERKQMSDFQNYIEKKYKGKSLNGFSFGVDDMVGTFTWTSKSGNTIYATPFWEDGKAVPVSVVDKDGDELTSKTHKLNPSDDVKALEAEYLKILKPYFSKIK